MTEKLKLHTPNITDENVTKIAALFPHCVSEGKIDFELLKQELSNSIIDGTQERYQLNWVGKREALLTANAPIAKTLRPNREESVNFDSTENLYIEGDNLDALKLLQETYLNKVKMIYIDPPYNTGNDFIYEDDFAENTADYLQRSNQKDESGNRLTANPESNGRFHSDWLSMMYPRLKLARNLLRDDGVIFISIDDNEQANLKRLCDEVFGEDNFIDIFSWQKTTTPPNLSTKTKKSCEYIIAYEKVDCGTLKGIVKESKSSNGLMNQTNPIGVLKFSSDVTITKLPNGIYNAGDYGTNSYKIELLQDTEVRDGFFIKPVELRGKFKWSQGYLDKQVSEGVKLFIQTTAFSPSYEKEEYEPEKPWNIINKSFGVGTNENASSELDELFTQNFSNKLYPKPTTLIRYLTNTNTSENDIILDFFSGSATTAHAVMQLNAEDGGKRKFIMVQIPEACDEKSEAFKAGYKTIADIGKERIRRAGQKIKTDNALTATDLDIGFRVLKVDSSNMNEVYYSPDAINKDDLHLFINNIKDDRSDEDLLFQVLLDWGVDLTLPIERQTIDGKTVFVVAVDAIVACFDRKGGVSESFIKELAKIKPLRAVFCDGGFANDSVKINVEQIFKTISPMTEIKTI